MPLSDEVAAFIDGHQVARLATADGSGAPHVIPLCYARADNDVYFVIDEKPKRGAPRELKRLRNIVANPRVALVIDDYASDWSQLAYLLIQGDAALVDDRVEYERMLTRLRTRYPQYQSMRLEFDTYPMVRISVRRAHLWRATQP